METKVTSRLNERFLSRDNDNPLTEDEIEALWEFYYDLESKVNILGRDFYLVKKELDRRLLKLRFHVEDIKTKKENAKLRKKIEESIKK